MNFTFNPLNPTTLVLAAILVAVIIYTYLRRRKKH